MLPDFVLVSMLLTLAACSNNTKNDVEDQAGSANSQADSGKSDKNGSGSQTTSDLQYVLDKGKLVVGVTDFAPMDSKNDKGEWVGFDADMAKAFAKSLGVEAEFVEIEWDNKIMELGNKSIDCAWNGMTLTDDVLAAMECTNPYMNNQQIVVVPASKADKYKTIEACSKLNFAVESGSAGEKVIKELKYNCTPVQNQANALTEVKSGTCDAAVIDSLMAAAMVGEGTGYADLTYTVGLNDEKYGVGFRKGSDLAAKLNEFFKTSYADGTMTKVAEQYGVTKALIEQ